MASTTSISLLPYSLSLVSIPRACVKNLGLPLLEQVMQPSFVSITMNETELSILTRHPITDFEHAARRQRRARTGDPNNANERIQVSPDSWRALQIDSHDEQAGLYGARVAELSAPLAAAGISILYQSSYQSDFIFVKTQRLPQVMSLLAEAGFDTYSDPSGDLHNSPKLSSAGSIDEDPSVLNLTGEDGNTTVLTRTRSTSSSSLPAAVESLELTDAPTRKPRADSESRSPQPGEVRVLPTHLTCVGLHDGDWSMKIAKLLFFPSLYLPPQTETEEPTEPTRGRRSPSTSSSQSTSDASGEDDDFFVDSPATTPLIPSSTPSSVDLLDTELQTPKPVSLPPMSMRPKLKQRPSSSSNSGGSRREPNVPFFSLTRTSEGSSLTADASHLALLFEPEERHMVMCGGELDAADRRKKGISTPEDDEDDEDNMRSMQCLQIDLRRFGLDKHGLVNLYSRVLEDANINHMYSSTVQTANLLVSKKHALKAQELLSSC